MLVDKILLDTTDRFPDNSVLAHHASRVSYGDLCTRAVRLASALQDHGVRQGDRVMIALENSMDYLVSYFGVILAGGVTVAINPDVKSAGLQKVVLDCTPSGIITRSDVLPVVKACTTVYPFRFVLLCDQNKSDRQADPTILSMARLPPCMICVSRRELPYE